MRVLLLKYWLPLGLLCFLVNSCNLQSSQFDPFLYGKVSKKIFVGSEERNYIIHVPSGYIGSKALPLVVVFHDHGDTGDNFYEKSGWKQIGEKENIFLVFPQAKTYCFQTTTGDEMKTGWNVSPVSSPTNCPADLLADDVNFLEKILEKTYIEYNIDKKNLYLEGFGEGGQMVAKTLLHASTSWTAASQYAGSYTKSHEFQTNRPVPVLFQVGNLDPIFFNNQVPVSLSNALQNVEDENSPFYPIVTTYTSAYQLTTGFQLAGDTMRIFKASYKANDGNELLEISLIKDVKHEYPNALNHFQAAAEHWMWMKKFGGL